MFLRIDPGDASTVGVKVLCSPGQQRADRDLLPAGERKLQIDFRHSGLADDMQYWDYDPTREEAFPTAGTVQAAPFHLAKGEALELRVFIDRTVMRCSPTAASALPSGSTRHARTAPQFGCSRSAARRARPSWKRGTWSRSHHGDADGRSATGNCRSLTCGPSGKTATGSTTSAKPSCSATTCEPC